MQWAGAALVLICVDGAAQLLYPMAKKSGARFRGFLSDYYPWELDTPRGMTTREAASLLWDHFRCPIVHRMGARPEKLLVAAGLPLVTKLGNAFTSDDAAMTRLEMLPIRPFSSPVLARNDTRIVMWVESLYWGLRIAISRSVDTEAKCHAIATHFEKGDYARG